MKTQLRLMLISFLLALWYTIPSFAASIDVTLIPSLVGDCSSTIQPYFNLSGTGTTADTTGPDRDWFGMVLFDGENQAIAYKYNWVSVGFSGSVTNWTFGAFTIVKQPASRPFTMRFYDISVVIADVNAAQNGPLLDTLIFDPASIGACTSLPLHRDPVSSVVAPFSDGRINNWDTGNPVVLFGHDYETGRGLVVYSPKGALFLEASPEQIAAIAECPSENTLIVSAGDVALYRLASCEYQLNAPSLDGTKTYVIIFNELYENTGYISHEE
jgi:hypothetical protein